MKKKISKPLKLNHEPNFHVYKLLLVHCQKWSSIIACKLNGFCMAWFCWKKWATNWLVWILAFLSFFFQELFFKVNYEPPYGQQKKRS
jgi:hypothetical protein